MSEKCDYLHHYGIGICADCLFERGCDYCYNRLCDFRSDIIHSDFKEDKRMIYLELLWTFLKIGAFTFGGGYAMLPLMQEEVMTHGWMDARSLIDFIAVSEISPGPFAVNIATYVGAETGGIAGSFCATLGVVLPSFIIILIIAKCFEKFKKSKIIKGCMSGLKPAVVGLIGAAAISAALTVFAPKGLRLSVLCDLSFYATVTVFLISVVLSFKKVHPILIICISALLGIVFGYL